MTPAYPDIGALNSLTEKIIGAAIEGHRHLGPGLLKSTYETCLIYERQRLGLRVERQKALPAQRTIGRTGSRDPVSPGARVDYADGNWVFEFARR